MNAKLLQLCLVAIFCLSKIAFAQWAVIDAGSIAQATLTAMRMLEQTRNQVVQMKRDAEFMQRQLKTLSELGWEDSYRLDKHLDFFNGLQNRYKSLTYRYQSMDEDFRKLYGSKNKPFSEKFKDWNQQTETSIQAAMKAHGTLDDSNRKMESVADLVRKQRKAEGDLQALQALGELSAIQAQQLEELKTIVATDSRAKQSFMMEQKSKENASLERAEHLKRDWSTKTKRKPLRRLPSLGKIEFTG